MRALRNLRCKAVVGICILAGCVNLAAQERRGPPFLTGPNQGNPLDIALRYIDQNRQQLGLTGADLNDVVVTDQYASAHNGVTHIYLRQRSNGIEVFNGNLGIHIARDGSVVHLSHSFVSNLTAAVNRRSPVRTASQGVEDAARHLGLRLGRPLTVLQSRGGAAAETVFDDGGISQEPIRARLVFDPVSRQSVRLAWEIEIYERSGDHWWLLTVDVENGQVLSQVDYVSRDNWDSFAGPLVPASPATEPGPAPQSATSNAYRVFALPKENPDDGPRTLESSPADPIASPFGWHDTNGVAGAEFTRTRGNNVHAYTDVDANNLPDPGSDPDGGASLVFDFPLDLGMDPSAYRPAAVTNLFYWNNIVHDVFYRYGFTEAAGNFQVNNYGRGGLGNDDVRAEAQDGSGTNNANFATPVDGFRPRMQMFVWTHPLPNLVTVNPGSPIAGDYQASGALFGPSLLASGPKTGNVTLANDGVGASTDACEPLVGFPAGNIALIDRGTCLFVIKVKNAQNAGATAVIMVNNVAGAPITMGGSDPTITIPSVMVSLADGTLFKANLPLSATLKPGPGGAPRDSDLDAGVIAHEYGHGISNRLTGGPGTVACLNNAEHMGEGWSDWLALALTPKPGQTATTSRGIGNYLVYETAAGVGIRPTPYSTDLTVNPTTYGSIAGLAIPHGVGYAWATMLWEVYWNLVQKHGFNPDVYGDWTTGGNNLAIQLVMDGMKLQACRPGFVDGRDAILLADQILTGGANQCAIWKGFTKRGLGWSASQGSSASTTDGAEAYDLPPACRAGITVNPTSISASQVVGTQGTRNLAIRNTSLPDGTNLSWSISEAPVSCFLPGDIPWLGVNPLGGLTPPANTSNVTLTFDATGLAIGTHTGRLCITTNALSLPVEVPVSLSVLYEFTGFFAPVSNPPEFNLASAPSTVPVMFSLNGDYGLNVFAAGFPVSQEIDCSTGASIGPTQPAGAPGKSGLSYSPLTGRYMFPWQTLPAWRGKCRQLIVRLNDGTDHVARFTFR